MATLKTGVIYLQKDKLQLYSPYVHSVIELRFAPEVVRDLDVLDEDKLHDQIKAFVTNGKVAPINLVIVLSDNAYFVKDFIIPAQPAQQPVKPGQPVPTAVPKVTLADLQPQIDLFIEHVPYENVVSKTFPLKNGLRVCAVNQDLYTTVEKAFEKLGFVVTAVFPGMVLGNGQSAKPVMDGGMVTLTLQKAPGLKQYDIKTQMAFTPASKREDEEAVDEVQDQLDSGKEPPKTNKKRLIAMIGIFVILLVVLVIVYMQSMQPPPPAQTSTVPTLMPQAATEKSSVSVAPTIEVAQFDSTTVQIVSTTASSSASSLRRSLETYKFKDVSVQTKTGVATSSTIISFSTNVNQLTRNAVLDEVKKVKSDVSIQERQEEINEITIVLGK